MVCYCIQTCGPSSFLYRLFQFDWSRSTFDFLFLAMANMERTSDNESLYLPMLLKLAFFLAVMAICFFIDTLRSRKYSSLDVVPGPWLARKTNLFMVQQQRGQKRPWSDLTLHKKYGPIVRIGPNEVMASSPSAFRTIYGKILLVVNTFIWCKNRTWTWLQKRRVVSRRMFDDREFLSTLLMICS